MIYAKIESKAVVGKRKKSFWDFLESDFSLKLDSLEFFYEVTYLDGEKKIVNKFPTLEQCIQELMKSDFIPVSEFLYYSEGQLK